VNVGTHRSSDTIDLDGVESACFIKVKVSELSSLYHLRGESAAELHHEEKHLIVGATREKNLASVQLIKRTSNRPHVKGWVVRDTEN
jgi:hypothetical protein